MPRGRPKKNLDLIPEVRESTEVSLMEQIKREIDGTKKQIESSQKMNRLQ